MITKYAIKLGGEYMRERYGDDCFTDDLGHAILFDTREAAEDELIGKERVVEIEEDEEGGLIDPNADEHSLNIEGHGRGDKILEQTNTERH